jgi:3',5'-cyclic-AMP phosphodiesterase
MNVANPSVVCVIPGDLHLTKPDLENHRVSRWMVGEVNHLVRPDFVQFIGDNVQDALEEQFRLFRDVAAPLCVPWYALVGDHDVKDDPRASHFRQWVGEPTGSLSLRGFRFVRLNTQEARPVGLSPEQLAWFRGEIEEAETAGERVVVFQHNYPYKVWETFAGPGIEEWHAIVQTRPIHTIFTGHTHYGQTANDGRNVVTATRSIGDPEGGAPGYTLVVLHHEDLAITYRTFDEQGPIVLITHPRKKLLATGLKHVVQGADEVRVRVWSGGEVTVQGRLDNGPWTPLQPNGPQEWMGPLAGEKLSKGDHYFHVRAVDDKGQRDEHSIEFAVDGTGRYTAVPMVRPSVSGTRFC